MRIIFVLSLLLTLSFPAFAGTTIHFEPGPYGGERIITPWGDYIAVQTGDTLWVGTEAEYDHARASNIIKKEGGREIIIEGADKNTSTYVSSSLPSIFMGGNDIANIDTAILFGVKPHKEGNRPNKPANSEYVNFSWVQSKKGNISPYILDLETHKSYSSYECVSDHEMRSCEIITPRAVLSHKSAVIFTMNKQKPCYLPTESIAKLHYKSIVDHVQELAKAGVMVTEDDKDDDTIVYLKELNKIDNSIPGDIGSILK